MSITTTYNYSSGSGFVYNTSLITFVSNMAQLLLNSNPGQTYVPTISSASYNAALLNYTAGALQQLDQRPATATFYAAWSSQLNANWSGAGNGSLTVTPVNSAAINAGVLDLTGSTNKYVTFNPTNNADSAQTGTIEFQVKPNYSGTPSNPQYFFVVSQDTTHANSSISIFHFTDGQIYLQIDANNGSQPLSQTGTFVPVAGTTYTFILNYNGAGGTGATQLYINGVSVISNATAFTRTGITLTNGVIGKIFSLGSGNANFSISNLSVYSTVLTPASPTLSATIYPTATANMPLFTYAGTGSVQSFTAFATTDVGGTQYTLNGMYYNGSAWVTSSGAFAQSNTAATINSNIAALAAANTLQINALYNAQNSPQQKVSAITVTYTGQAYSTTGPTIAPNMALTMDSLSVFTVVDTIPSPTQVNWLMGLNGVKYWFNGTIWTTSNGTYAQSNTAAQIQTNASTLPITLGASVIPYAVIYSPDGLSSPMLTSLTLTYDYFGPEPTPPQVCNVFGYVIDESGNPVSNAVVTVENPTTFINSGITVAQGLYTINTDSIGYFHINLVETASLTTPPQMYFTIVYPYNVSANIGTPPNTYVYGMAPIPNTPEANITSLTFSPIM